MGKEPQKHRLTLSRLDFVSLVDDPAQPNAKTLLIKRRGTAADVSGFARYVKAADDIGLAFFWAFTSTNLDGTDHYDLHNDAVAADTAMIKAAMDFMLAGGAVDEMHDGEARDGARVAFAFPMTPEIAKAFNIDTKQSGLMVALKVTPEQLAKLKDGTYTGVSIAGMGTREPVRARKSADKRYLTDEVLGHQHEFYAYEDGSGGWMADATAEGAQAPHRHTVIRDESGQLVVLADSGHTHTLTEAPVVIVAPDDATVVSESVAARAKHESPRASKSRSMTITKENAVDELAELKALKEKLEAKIAELEAQLVEARTDAELTDEEKAHLAGLSTTEAKRFRSLEKAARLAEIQKAKDADPVVLTFKGVDYRASMGPHVIELAKEAKANADEIEKARVAKAATDLLGGLGGNEEEHILIASALLKGVPADKLDAVKTVVKGWREQAKARAKAPGFDGGGGSGSSGNAYEALTKGLTAFCKEHKIDKVWTVGLEKFKATDDGAALHRTYLESITG